MPTRGAQAKGKAGQGQPRPACSSEHQSGGRRQANRPDHPRVSHRAKAGIFRTIQPAEILAPEKALRALAKRDLPTRAQTPEEYHLTRRAEVAHYDDALP